MYSTGSRSPSARVRPRHPAAKNTWSRHERLANPVLCDDPHNSTGESKVKRPHRGQKPSPRTTVSNADIGRLLNFLGGGQHGWSLEQTLRATAGALRRRFSYFFEINFAFFPDLHIVSNNALIEFANISLSMTMTVIEPIYEIKKMYLSKIVILPLNSKSSGNILY